MTTGNASPPAAEGVRRNDDHATPRVALSTLSFQVEIATDRAWPALRRERVGPWTLRFADGYTKRSNSAWLLPRPAVLPGNGDGARNTFHAPGDAPDGDGPASPEAPSHAARNALERVEAAYAARGLPPIFKLAAGLPSASQGAAAADPKRFPAMPGATPDAAPTEVLDAVLAERGYVRRDPTLVLVRELPDHEATSPDTAFVSASPEAWYARWCACGNASHPTHLRLLERVAPGAFFACLPAGQRDAPSPSAAGCCALAVPDPALPFWGIFDVATRPELRRQGLASRLVAALLRAAASRGPGRAYLQVLEANVPARALYAGLGFRELHRYWYRVRD